MKARVQAVALATACWTVLIPLTALNRPLTAAGIG